MIRIKRNPLTPGLAVYVVLTLSHPACQSDAPPTAATEETPDPEVAELIASLETLSAILEDTSQPVDATLQTLRDHINTHRDTLVTYRERLRRRRQDLSSEDRITYIDRHRPLVHQALTRFAKAQQTFRARANQAQRYELNYLLRSLR